MKTPAEKYDNDPQYRTLVDILLVQLIHAKFTPSELREAAVFASIKYEHLNVRSHIAPMTPEVEEALRFLRNYVSE